MNFINKKNWFYRLQQLIILIAHLALLKWILWVLGETNLMQPGEVLLHFTGLALAGAGLIYGCAMWAKYHHQKELKQGQALQEKHES